MELIEVTRNLSATTIAPVYFVHGPERFLVAEFVTKIKELVVVGPMGDFNYLRCKADEISGAKIAADARSMPMMAQKRLIIIDDVDKLKAADIVHLEAYLENPSPETVLILIGTKFDLRKGIFSKANRKKLVFSADALRDKEIMPFIAARALARGVALEKGVDGLIAASLGPDASAIDDAVERLGLFAGGKKVTAEHVAASISAIRQNSVFDLAESIGQRNTGRALGLLEEFLGNREEPLRLAALVARHIRQLIGAKVLSVQRGDSAQIARVLGVPPFVVSKLVAQSRGFSGAQLEASLLRLARADIELKSSRRPSGIILEEAVMDLCRIE